MRSFTFTVVLDHRPTETELDKFADNAWDDAAFGTERGVPIVEFDREADSLAEAIAAAVMELEDVGLLALRVVDQDLVTLADIADRVGQSRESFRRYATGDRGPGGFPPPVNPARDGTVFYRWSEVAPWIQTKLGVEVRSEDPALVLGNLVIQARRLVGSVQGSKALTKLLD